MNIKPDTKQFFLTFTIVTLSWLIIPASWAGGFQGGAPEALGPMMNTNPHMEFNYEQMRNKEDPANWVRNWNKIAIQAIALDHTPVPPGETRVYGEQLGPARSSRAMAIVHIAIFDAVNAINGHYRSYTDLQPVDSGTSIEAAISQAAHDTLTALYPSQAKDFDKLLTDDLNLIKDDWTKTSGINLGKHAASNILEQRANDGSQHDEPFIGIDFFNSKEPGKWRLDPISLNPLALGAYWGRVKPFVMQSSSQFRAPQPPRLDSPEYAAAFNEVKRLGGDGVTTPTERTEDQTHHGIFCSYDGTPGLGTPPRLYNQIALYIADKQQTNKTVELARLLALVNVAMADTGIAVWETKYYYQYWRPVTGMREADAGTGPTDDGDNNPETLGDPSFMPLGAQSSNLLGPNFTPPFPSYPSGHAGFGGALFQTLRNFYGTDNIAFTYMSDEFNGITKDNQGNTRPKLELSFSSLSEAEETNAKSRIYLGVHWTFDKTAGVAQGRNVANYVFKNAFTPLH